MPSKAQGTALTKKKRRDFIEALAPGMSVTSAAKFAGFSRVYAYQVKDADPEFASAWDDAIEQATDLLEDAIRKRAIQGELEPIFYKGVQVATVPKTSDLLKMFLMKARHPEYRDNNKVEIQVGDKLGELMDAISGKAEEPAAEVTVSEPTEESAT